MAAEFRPELSYRPDWWPKRCPIFVSTYQYMSYIWNIWCCTYIVCAPAGPETVICAPSLNNRLTNIGQLLTSIGRNCIFDRTRILHRCYQILTKMKKTEFFFKRTFRHFEECSANNTQKWYLGLPKRIQLTFMISYIAFINIIIN